MNETFENIMQHTELEVLLTVLPAVLLVKM